jgi:hypothetical protein
MHLFERMLVTKPNHPGLKVWSEPRQHWRHHIEPGTKLKNELVDCGVWWVAQYDDGTECRGVCPWRVASEACGFAKERA